MMLTQTGTMVVGTVSIDPVHPLAVTGHAEATTLTLDEATVDLGLQSGVDAQILRLRAWTSTRDDLGRMQGAFTYVVETHWTPQRQPAVTWTITYDADLDGVVAVP